MVGKTTREHPKTEEEQLSEVAKAAFDWQGTCYDAFTEQRAELQEKVSNMTEEELKEFRNSLDPDSMGFFGEESV